MTVGQRGKKLDYAKLPKQLDRAGGARELYVAWRKMQRSVCSLDLLNGMPKAITYVAERVYEVEPHMAVEAIRRGDSALFIAILVRLAQIDTALIAAGKSLADRSPVLYAKHFVEGFRTVADESFVELGGTPL